MPRMSAEELEEFIHSSFSNKELRIFHVEKVEDMYAQVRLPFHERLLRPGGTVSGPAMMTLADTAMYVALLAMIGPVALAVTTSLNINFLRKPAPGDESVPRGGQGLTPVDELRRRARQGLMDGALTSSYTLDPKAVVGLLNEALATELVCALRYKRHYYVAKGIKSRLAASEFLEHAQQEAEHADRIAERIVQLGGNPDFNPATLTQRAHASYHDGTALRDDEQEKWNEK